MNLRNPSRRTPIGLTPMIDVVFLLLVFFMLAARFTTEGAITVPLGTTTVSASDAPRLIDVTSGALRLNGADMPLEELPTALARLLSDPSETIVLRPREGASVQRVVEVLEALTASGFSNVVLVE